MRFPDDFMFQLTLEELENWKSQIVISNREKMGLRKPPLAFTEQGVAMLSSVLNSERAILVNIQIIRIVCKEVNSPGYFRFIILSGRYSELQPEQRAGTSSNVLFWPSRLELSEGYKK